MSKNIYTKLLEARVEFLAKGTKKSGNNKAIHYNYFELEDIVPMVTEIFSKLGLVSIVEFDGNVINRTSTDNSKEGDKLVNQIGNVYDCSGGVAKMTLVNCEKPEETIVFTTPFVTPKPNNGTNEAQVMGAAITYYRRYLYMICMNVIESDGIDCGTPDKPTKSESKPIEIKGGVPKASKPVTPQERKEIKAEIVDGDGLIDEAMKNVLIKKVGELLKASPDQKAFLVALKDKTNGFNDIKKSDYPAFLKAITDKIGG